VTVSAWDATRAALWPHALYVTREHTGVVIPVYLPEGIDARQGETLLRETVQAYNAQLADSSAMCLSVDGAPFGAEIAHRLAEELGTSIHVAANNRGKLAAAANGVRTLLQDPDLAYVAVVDQDGDHFANELPNFVRAALHVAHASGEPIGDGRVMVLGRRISRHRPMGFLRGELEEFADRILLDALAYRAAVTGRPLRLEYALTLDEFPDFHSGYKLFSRRTAQDVFLGKPQLARVTDDCYYRHAVEAVMAVEALEHGAYLGVVNRSTLNEQPISTFGLLNLSQLAADKIIWPCKRLDIPAPFVRQWMANHAPRLLLNTLVPAGKDELARIQERVLAAFGEEPGPEPPRQPLFV
jgi:hypothetical protein